MGNLGISQINPPASPELPDSEAGAPARVWPSQLEASQAANEEQAVLEAQANLVLGRAEAEDHGAFSVNELHAPVPECGACSSVPRGHNAGGR